MKRSRITIRSFAGFALALSGLLSWAAWPIRTSSATAPPAGAAAYVPTYAEAGEDEKKNLLATFAEMPLQFVENRGQVDSRVAFYVQGRDRTLYFSPQGITFALTGEVTRRSSRETTNAEALFSPAGFSRDFVASDTRQHWALKLDFVNANPRVRLKGQGPARTVTSYFLGPRDRWRTGLASYANLVYENLWPGIDLVYSGSANRLKYQFVVKPGANANRIKLAYRGASSVSLNGQGQLAVTTLLGEFHDDTPSSYQEINGQRVAVNTSYALETKVRAGKQGYSFRIGDYDSSRPLVIDPAIVIYAGYIGGAGDERGLGIAVDSAGSAYVTGETSSSQATFPVSAGADMTFDGGRDAFIVKLNATGSGIVYATYIGGTGDDIGLDIAVDSAGNAYITGSTSSTQTSFPVTVGPDLSHNGGVYDAFVAKLNAAGTALMYCGYIGGSDEDGGTAIALDGSGNAYITGATSSNEGTFPVSIGPDLTYNGGLFIGDAFIAKVNVAGTALAYCGYIGGSGEDAGMGIAVDSSGNAYIAGGTTSWETTFPVAVGPDLTYNGGVRDGFVAKVNPAGTSLVYAGYIGGESGDTALGIAVDGAGNAYVTGDTGSAETGFPVTVGPDLTYNGGGDAFIAKINPAGTALVYCGYIGGAGRDVGTDIRLDNGGNAYVTGATASNEATFPVSVGPALNFNGGGFNGDAFVAKVKATGLTLDYCGYLGGNGDDIANALALDSDGNVYIAGETTSTQATFPATGGPDLTYNGGVRDAFVARVGAGCTFSINPTAQSFAASGGTGSVSVAAGIGCGWTATSNDLWIAVNPGGSRVGGGTANYSLTANSGPARTGTITVAGQTFNVTQAGSGATPTPTPQTVQFSAPSYSVNENGNVATINVTRLGDTTSAATVNYATSDAAALSPCTPSQSSISGQASERCDYATSVGTIRFAAGEGGSKSFTIPIINDVHVEGSEVFSLTLSNPTGINLGSPNAAIVSITDDDTSPPASNPINGADFFIRQQYIDFLNRLPDTIGLQNWHNTLDPCPNNGFGENDNPGCDRIHVSSEFFLSQEFQGRGYFAFRFYMVSFGQRPTYAQFIPDMAKVGGPKSPQEEELSKVEFSDEFVLRPAFVARYGGLTDPTAYVDVLLVTADVPTLPIRSSLISGLQSGQKTRGRVLREIAESPEVFNKFLIESTVAIQYFGYLRRDPDTTGYNNWIQTLTQDPTNMRHMVFGFLYSNEYRGRFGPQ